MVTVARRVVGFRGRGPGADERERGSVPLELVIVAPVLLGLLMLVIYGGRVVASESNVQSSASAAARAASLGGAGGAEAVVAEVARANLAETGMSCGGGYDASVLWEQTDFSPGGHVTVRVSCSADLSGLGFVGVPSYRATATATEVIDDLRGSGG